MYNLLRLSVNLLSYFKYFNIIISYRKFISLSGKKKDIFKFCNIFTYFIFYPLSINTIINSLSCKVAYFSYFNTFVEKKHNSLIYCNYKKLKIYQVVFNFKFVNKLVKNFTQKSIQN